jgi:hypothetical protein
MCLLEWYDWNDVDTDDDDDGVEVDDDGMLIHAFATEPIIASRN